ncbi:MAG: TrmH family RNA methyltransferase [Solirubrobacteraceae bacterium]
MILYGRNPVREALRGRRAHAVSEVWVTAGAAKEPWLKGAKVRVCGAEDIERRCGSPVHQGVCAEAGGFPYVAPEELLRRPDPWIVALDQVQDPQNLGSICRTAECVGATGVVIPERRSAEITPAVCKASAGAVEHIRVARVRNIADFLVEARAAGCWSYGASAPVGSPGGKGPERVMYTTPDYSGGIVLVLGSEGSGLRPRVATTCDQLVALPLHGRMESLGVAAAASALLYGILHDREARLDKAP